MERPPIKIGSCKVYIDVNVHFDTDGKMTPVSLIWEDGHEYKIDSVLSVCHAPALRGGGLGDRYEIMIGDKISYIWFAHNVSTSERCVGWWFAERSEK